jgi:hypothetical protein
LMDLKFNLTARNVAQTSVVAGKTNITTKLTRRMTKRRRIWRQRPWEILVVQPTLKWV